MQQPTEYDGRAFVLDRAQAQDFVARRIVAKSVVAMSPSARADLEKAGLAALPSDMLYPDAAHARVLVRMEAAEVLLRLGAERMGIDGAAVDVLAWQAVQASAVAGAFWEILGDEGPWIVCAKGAWPSFAAKEDAHSALLRALSDHNPTWDEHKSDGAYFLRVSAALSRGLLAVCLPFARISKSVVFPHMDRGFAGLANAISDAGATTIVLGLADGSYRAVFAHLWKLLAGKFVSMRLQIPSHPDPATERQLAALLGSLAEDEIVARGYMAFGPAMARRASVAKTFADGLTPVVRKLNVRSLLIWDCVTPRAVGLAEAARRAGAKVVVASHATVSVGAPADAVWMRNRLGSAVAASSRADICIVQSPTLAALVGRLRPGVPQLAAKPFFWSKKSANKVAAAPNEPALFLWAGNFQSWPMHRPWIEETADETLAALQRFAEAVLATSAQLEVRVKPSWRHKGELDEAALRQFLPADPRIAIRAEGSFVESLGRATAVVTHSSTALEEAFDARVPVVLWGTRGRSAHLSGLRTAPTAAERAAVYAPTWDANLAEFLEAVANAHKDAPLTDRELDGLVWPGEGAGFDAIARILADPDAYIASAKSSAGAVRETSNVV